MRFLVFFFLLLLGAIWVGIEMSHDPGYILITYGQWNIETSLWVALIIIIITFIVLYFILRLLNRIFTLSTKISRWQRMRNIRIGKHLTNLGLCQLAEGQWKKAEHSLLKAARYIKSPLINYLGAAHAAQHMETFEKRDEYLHKAHLSTKGSAVAVGLTQAQLQIQSGQWEQAVATLQHLYRLNPKHKYSLKLLSSVYTKVNDQEKLKSLLPALRKYQVVSDEELITIEVSIYSSELGGANKQDLITLNQTWHKIPRYIQQQNKILHQYISYLIKKESLNDAISLIEATIKKQWDPVLIKHYGLIRHSDGNSALNKAEHWLKKYPNEPELLLCLGHLSMRQKLWGKAKDYLNETIKRQPSPIAFNALGEAYTALGESEKAMQCFRQGIAIAGKT